MNDSPLAQSRLTIRAAPLPKLTWSVSEATYWIVHRQDPATVGTPRYFLPQYEEIVAALEARVQGCPRKWQPLPGPTPANWPPAWQYRAWMRVWLRKTGLPPAELLEAYKLSREAEAVTAEYEPEYERALEEINYWVREGKLKAKGHSSKDSVDPREEIPSDIIDENRSIQRDGRVLVAEVKDFRFLKDKRRIFYKVEFLVDNVRAIWPALGASDAPSGGFWPEESAHGPNITNLTLHTPVTATDAPTRTRPTATDEAIPTGGKNPQKGKPAFEWEKGKILLQAKKKCGDWVEAPSDEDSREYLRIHFRGVPNTEHSEIRRAVWGASKRGRKPNPRRGIKAVQHTVK
jgi:hypothetical protein